MKDKALEEKLFYTGIAGILTLCNILLINTRFQVFGLFLGVVAITFNIKALMIRKNEKSNN